MKIPPHAEKVFEGVIFDIYQWQQEMFDGTFRTFEFLKRKHSALVFAVFPDKTILVSEEEQPARPPFISLPGGGADSYEEEPLETAKRELLEETGYVANEWRVFYVNRDFSKVDWAIHYFIARDLTKVSEPKNSASEKIISKRLSFDEFINLHDHPKLRDKGMQYYMLKAKTDQSFCLELEKQLFG